MWLRFSYNNNMYLLQNMGAKVEQLLLILCIIIPILSAQDSDLDNLRTLKNAWQNTPPTWDDRSDPCTVGSWEGITCTNGRVTKITLSSMQLSGELPEDIDQFTELEILDLSYNKDLGGLLTSKIGNLKNLNNLILVGCSFTGPIPETIGNLESLVYLSLNSNSFTGRIPSSIGNLKNLVWLDLSTNNLNGSLPVSSQTTPGLDNLTHAKHFHLGDNQLSGVIPLRLFNSNMKLIHLLLENNMLTGTIPSTLGLVTSLTVVRLDKNLLSGSVPSNINNLTNTTEMFLSNNRLTGPIPDLTGMSVLNYIDLSNNFFDPSDVPSWLSTLHALTTIKMQNTNLGGEIPVALFRLPQLQHVVLSNNQINGTLDISSNPSTQLELVDLRTNDITDFTQRHLYRDSIDLILQGNLICTESGVNETFCSNTTNTTLLNLSYSTPSNNCAPTSCVDGRVSSPNCECAFPYTGFFTFKAPSFSSTLNSTIYISLLDSLMGFFKNASLPVDSISLNNLSRNSEDYLMVRLDVFPLGPQGCFNRTGILEIGFALSNQTFKPKKDFNTYVFGAESYSKFCSGILLGTGDTKKKSSNTGIIIGSVVGGCVFVVLLVLAGIYAFRRKNGVERATQQSQPFALWDPTSASGSVPQIKGVRSFTYEELQKYTNNFSEINNIGKGGYGMVYKGSLPNGQLIAIKRAKEGSSQGGLEFKTEIELLSRVHHKNVVGLIGFCFDQGEQMLVYEYIVNGTLKDSLSGRSGIRLDWTRRLKIALGAARGLQYLHDHADPPIIHRDVKTNNILLDERLVAKVSDFGLSKPLSDADRTYVTTQVKGTMGYMDPEYYMTQQLTEKSDVYSFGVVMLELITARNPIEKGRYIVREVKLIMDKNKELYDLQDVLDPTIGLSSQLKGLERFVDLALMCVEDTGQQRPTMSEVVKELESIMDLVGLNHGTESSTSTSVSYEGTGKDHSYPYSNDSLFTYSEGSLSPKLHPK